MKQVVFSLFERKSMDPTSCTCSTAAWFCVSPTNQSFRDGDGTKTSSGIGSRTRHHALCKHPKKTANVLHLNVYSQISQPQKL